MILSHRLRFIFFCNGKTGTTSIERNLAHLNEGQRYAFAVKGLFIEKHIPPIMLKACLPREMWAAYFKFVFVRNPFDWIVSQWNWNFNVKFRALPEGHPARRAVSGDPGDYPVPSVLGRGLRELASVERFAPRDIEFLFDFLKRNHRVVPYADGCYQCSFVHDADGVQLVDHIGRFETLAADYARIAARLGLPAQLPHVNRGTTRDYRSYFTPESAACAARLWAADFKAFGYDTISAS